MKVWAILVLALAATTAHAQRRSSPFADMEVRVDTTLYSLGTSSLTLQGQRVLGFPLRQADQAVDVFFYLEENAPVLPVALLPSKDFAVVDSFRLVDSAYYRGRIQFGDLTKFTTTTLALRVGKADGRVLEYPLLPYVATWARLQAKDDEAYLGEEKVLDVAAGNLANIRADNVWIAQGDVEYKLGIAGNQLRLTVVATTPGQRELTIPIALQRPIVLGGKVVQELPPLRYVFTAKASRTQYLGLDRKEITLDFATPRGIEIQLDRNRNLVLHKTYRIETTAETGGAFVGELYTRSALSNDKVLAWIRPFALHKASDGYLYIKDQDELKFITNIAISEKTKISKVQLLREGGDYTDNLTVYPGERVEVRIEGTGLERAAFFFDGAANAVRDSALATENVSVYRMQIPADVVKRKIVMFRDKQSTGYELTVREYQRPRQLDFVSINWGAGAKEVRTLTKPILYDKTMQELTLTFNPAIIDQGAKLYGKQYLNVEINIYNTRKDLIETRTINDAIVVCPAENSPRGAFYSGAECTITPINLNQYLGHKTFDLADWSTIEVTVRHNPFKYSGTPGYAQKVELVLQRHVTFDIDVSIPAGLLVKQFSGENASSFGSFSSISLAIVPQLSFYQPDKINKLRPYRIGLGVLALNAFNFSEATDTKRDVGVVVLGSVFPTRTGQRFSFPLYAGFGYFVKASSFFYVIGPGVQVRF